MRRQIKLWGSFLVFAASAAAFVFADDGRIMLGALVVGAAALCAWAEELTKYSPLNYGQEADVVEGED